MVSENIDYTSMRILGSRFDHTRKAVSSIKELFDQYSGKGNYHNFRLIHFSVDGNARKKYPWSKDYDDYFYSDNYKDCYTNYVSDLKELLFQPIRLKNMTSKEYHIAKIHQKEFLRKANRCTRCNKFIAPWMLGEYQTQGFQLSYIKPLCPKCMNETQISLREERLRSRLDLTVSRNVNQLPFQNNASSTNQIEIRTSYMSDIV